MTTLAGDYSSQALKGYPNNANGFVNKGAVFGHYPHNAPIQRAHLYLQHNPNAMPQNMADGNVAALSQAFGGMNLPRAAQPLHHLLLPLLLLFLLQKVTSSL